MIEAIERVLPGATADTVIKLGNGAKRSHRCVMLALCYINFLLPRFFGASNMRTLPASSANFANRRVAPQLRPGVRARCQEPLCSVIDADLTSAQ